MKKQFGGVLCPNYGFTQHTGECWHDGFSTIILFSDIINERIQSIILDENFDLDNFIYSKKLYNFLLPINYDFTEVDKFNLISKIYIEAFISRFKNKMIDNELSLKEFIDKKPSVEEKKLSPLPERITRSSSYINSITCASNTNERYNHNHNYILEKWDSPGGIDLHELLNLQLINYYFQVDKTFINIKKFNKKNISELTLDFMHNITGISLYLNDKHTKIFKDRHYTAFYKCNEQLYYYDNEGLENGNVIIEFNWKSIINNISLDSDFFYNLENALIKVSNQMNYNRIDYIVCYYIDKFDNEEDYYKKIFYNYNYLCSYKNDRLMELSKNKIILDISENIFGYVHCNLPDVEKNEIYQSYEKWLKILKIDGLLLKYAPEEIKCSVELLVEAVKQNYKAYYFINNGLENDFNIIKEVAKKDLNVLFNKNIELITNPEIVEIMNSYTDIEDTVKVERIKSSYGIHDNSNDIVFNFKKYKKYKLKYIKLKNNL